FSQLGSPPTSVSAWEDTRLLLPAELAGGHYRCVLSGAEHTIESGPLDLAKLLRELPCTMLERLDHGG
ncbi:MAG TPA: hypothetical protein VK524_23655, partial [Polyangiaceae bacterium]|nr:hypothetical protein [Polyangiaceae bacterium]